MNFEKAVGSNSRAFSPHLIFDEEIISMLEGPVRYTQDAWFVSINGPDANSAGRSIFNNIKNKDSKHAQKFYATDLFIETSEGDLIKINAPMNIKDVFKGEDMEDPEETIMIDFNSMNESVFTMFGAWIEYALRRLMAGASANIKVKGSPDQVKSFARTLGAEKKYLETFVENGLADPKTYRSKAVLDKSASQFERKTGIKWPFK